MPRGSLALGAVALIAMLGFVMVLLATPMGIGISPDSIAYISAARNLLSGNGLTVSYDLAPEGKHLQSWIQERWGYPALLAAAGAFGADPLVAARWVSAIFFAANIFLAGFIILRQPCGRNWLLPPATSLLMMLSVESMLLVHSMAWSEPPFIFFGFLGVYLLSGYLDKGRFWRLLGAAAAIAAASAMRLAGVAFIAAGIVTMALTSRERLWKKAVDSVIFLSISGGVFAVWFYRKAADMAETFSFHRITSQHLKILCKAMGQWLPMGMVSRVAAGILLLAIGAAIIAGLIRFARNRRSKAEQLLLSSNLPVLLSAFIFFHICFYAGVVSFVSIESGLNTRNYAPLFVAILILAMCMSGPLLGVFLRDEGRCKKALAVLCAIFIVGYAARSAVWFFNVRKDGQEFASRIFQESEVLCLVKDLPAQTLIFSNLPEAVYIVTGRSAYLVPKKNLLGSTIVRRELEAELDCMQKYMRHKKSKFVFIQGLERSFLVSLDVLIDRLHLRLVSQARDGAIYEAAD